MTWTWTDFEQLPLSVYRILIEQLEREQDETDG
jgi:hypothetical protein